MNRTIDNISIKHTVWCMIIGVVVISLLFWAIDGFAQERYCANGRFNSQGVAGADIVVSNSAVIVMEENGQRCGALLYNTSTEDVRCASEGTVPTADVGILIKTDRSLSLGREDAVTAAWSCIRAGAADGAVNVMEVLR